MHASTSLLATLLLALTLPASADTWVFYVPGSQVPAGRAKPDASALRAGLSQLILRARGEALQSINCSKGADYIATMIHRYPFFTYEPYVVKIGRDGVRCVNPAGTEAVVLSAEELSAPGGPFQLRSLEGAVYLTLRSAPESALPSLRAQGAVFEDKEISDAVDRARAGWERDARRQSRVEAISACVAAASCFDSRTGWQLVVP